MIRGTGCTLPFACCALLSLSASARGDDDDKVVGSAQQAVQPGLNSEQQQAAGIVVAHPRAAKAPQRIEALGMVLDATNLLADSSEAAAAAASARAVAAELARLQALYSGGAGASLKMLEAARAEQARAQAQAQIAAARFALHWGPINGLPVAQREKLIQAAASGTSLLLRADLPGRHSLGTLPSTAVLEVDGIQVMGRVLGVLRETTELQGVGLLIEVSGAPSGLGAGARLPVALLSAQRSGLSLPGGALLFDENGAYVFKQLSQAKAAEKARYVPVKVNLLVPYGDGWLVGGIDADDNIVVHGAGVLWSLQTIGAQQHDDDD